MTARTRRFLAVASVLCVLALGITLAGSALGAETDVLADSGHASLSDGQSLGDRSAPFAQADDEDDEDDEDEEDTRVINITNAGENVEYTLTAPSLDPVAPYVEVGENAEDAENPDVVRGDTAFGVIGGGAYDTYRFTGPIEDVELQSGNIEELEVRIDGESVDPRTLNGEETETATETPTPTTTATATPTATETETATTTTATETATTTATTTETATETPTATTTATATETATASETAAPTSTSTAGPSPTPSATTTDSTPTTAVSGGESGGGGGFTLLMYVLIGVITGLVLAASLAYVVRS
jgi:septal ring-binding cell division protein DamX